MYRKLPNDPLTNEPSRIILRLSDNAQFTASLENIDYLIFKKDIANNAIVQNFDGVEFSSEEKQEFLATLP